MPALTLQQQRWKELLEQLEEFLARWQQNPQNKLDVDQLTQVYRLYAAWREEREEPLDHSEYGLRLGPLLCRDAEQQNLFRRLWQSHPIQNKENSSVDSANGTTQNLSSPTQSITGSWYDSPQKRINQRLKRLAMVLALVMLGVAAGVAYQYWLQAHPKPTVVESGPLKDLTETETKAKPSAAPINLEKPYVTTIPKRQPPLALALSELEKQQLADMRYLVLAAALVVIGLVIGLIWWQRRVVFQSHFSREGDQDQLHLKLQSQAAYSELIPGFGAVLAKLRFAKVGLKKIHWGKTIAATVRRGGFPDLRYRDRYRQVDFVLMTDSRHRYDQTAWLMDKLNETLSKAQVRVHQYDFDRHPDWLWPNGDRTSKPLQLEQILLRHPASRILLVSEHDVLFYRLTGEIQDWLKRLHEHPSYQLGLLSQPDLEQQQRLQKGHYPFRLLNNIKNLTPLLDFSKPENDNTTKSLPLFESDWLGNIQPEDTQIVLDWLQATIGDDGKRLLNALALYPKLDGELTLALYQQFAGSLPDTPKPPLKLDAILKTAALPWCRQGWLPHWLRHTLLTAMPRADYQHARRFFLRLFDSKSPQTGTALGLVLQKPSPFWRRIPWLRHMSNHAGFNSPMRDQIFTRILLWPRNPLTQLPLLRRLMNALSNAALSQWGAVAALSLLMTLLLATVYLGWHWQGANLYGNYLLQQKQQQNAKTLILIRYHPSVEPLKEIFGAGLSGLGYQVAATVDETLTVNRMIAPQKLMNDINNAIAYLSWGSEFAKLTKGENTSIELATLPQTAQVFRDSLPEQPQLATRYADPIPWQSTKKVNIPVDQFMDHSYGTDMTTKITDLTVGAPPRQESISQAGEVDWYRFISPAASTYTIDTQGSTDIFMALFGPNNQTTLVAEDDDSGQGSTSRIVSNLSAGTYFVRIRHYQVSKGTGNYGISVSGAVQPQPNLTEIVVNGPAIQGNIAAANESDVYTFNATQTATYTIATTGNIDTVVSLNGPNNQNSFISQDDSGPGQTSLIVRVLTPGMYYVRVRHYSTTGTGAYGISVKRT